jgi:hypothetical protein
MPRGVKYGRWESEDRARALETLRKATIVEICIGEYPTPKRLWNNILT